MDFFVRLAADAALLMLLMITMPILLWNLKDRWWVNAPVLIMAGLTSLLMGKIMSLVYQPVVARPFIELGVEPGASYINNPGFPSDHVLLATVLVIAVYALTKRTSLALFLGMVVILIGIARVMAFVHTPVDIAGGVIAGLFGSAWYKKLTK